MSEAMDIVGEIERHLRRDPFEPFVVVMSSGDRYAVEIPDRTVVGRSVIVVVPLGDGHNLRRLSQISSVEFTGS